MFLVYRQSLVINNVYLPYIPWRAQIYSNSIEKYKALPLSNLLLLLGPESTHSAPDNHLSSRPSHHSSKNNKPFHRRSGMTRNCFPITDLTTNQPVETTMIQVQRPPLSRAKGCSDEEYFLTLQPNIPAVVSTRFARGSEDARPLSKAAAQREREKAIRTKTARRSQFACGVDGIEPGHRYQVKVAKGPLMSFWWRWGTKEDVLVEPRSQGWPLYSLESEEGVVEVDEINDVEFTVEK